MLQPNIPEQPCPEPHRVKPQAQWQTALTPLFLCHRAEDFNHSGTQLTGALFGAAVWRKKFPLSLQNTMVTQLRHHVIGLIMTEKHLSSLRIQDNLFFYVLEPGAGLKY